MSEYAEEENMAEAVHLDDEILAIQAAYRRKRLIESLVGPVVSTMFHVAIIFVMAITITDTSFTQKAEIEIELAEQQEDIKIEEEIEEPDVEEEEIEETEVETADISPDIEDDSAAEEEEVSDEPLTSDDGQDYDEYSDVTVSMSAFSSTDVRGGRTESGRKGALKRHGGSKRGQIALLKSLKWLQSVQNPDGSWGSARGTRSAMTGLSLLTFLAHGETPTSRLYGSTVKKAIQWLVNSPTDTSSSHAYPHAIKAYALGEAYAMTDNSSIVPALRTAMEIIVKGQQDGGSFYYNYAKGEKADLSFAGWNYQAMKACYATNLDIPGLEDGIRKSIKWLKLMASKSHSFPYRITGTRPSGGGRDTMRAVGVLCLQIFGEGKTAVLKDELQRISREDLKNFKWNKPPKASLYGWYYATQAMFQGGSKYWKSWNRVFQKELINNQAKAGYWEYPDGGHGSSAGDETSQRVYATTLCSLMLTVYYRYLPGAVAGGFEAKARKKNKEKSAKAGKAAEENEEILDLLDF
ncbi:MAG: hypothetical protein HRT88_04485 [Lentisphaeraceae bacterium]|nr:hypothetical protein [Lentisphaeraceae bacterium]